MKIEETFQVPTSIERVWDVISDVAAWSSVYAELRDVEVEGPVAVGTGFSFKSGPGRIDAEITRADPPEVFVFQGRGMGATSHYAFRLASAPDGTTELAAAQSMSGRAIRPMKRMLQRIADTSLQDWLRGIAETAERDA